jgi:hypothetical protein
VQLTKRRGIRGYVTRITATHWVIEYAQSCFARGEEDNHYRWSWNCLSEPCNIRIEGKE